MNNRLKKTFVVTLILVTFGLSAVYAQEGPSIQGRIQINDSPQFEIFVSTFASDVDLFGGKSTGNAGLRGSYPLTKRFAVEGSVMKLGNYDDLWMTDVSAKYYLKNSGRTGVYVAGGPGLIFGSGASEATAHLGLGLEIQATRHIYVRPEVRGVALMDNLDANDVDFSLGLGWRF